MSDFLSINDLLLPRILIAEKDFIVVYKPPRMHSAPLQKSARETPVHEGTILDWCCREFPEIAELGGRGAGEGGLLHRLDYETQGLMLLARTQQGMEVLLEQQKQGKIVKEYSALASESKTILPGFPQEKPQITPQGIVSLMTQPLFRITSGFRSYGSGRKAVRPVLFDALMTPAKGSKKKNRETVLDGGKPYVTEIIDTQSVSPEVNFFRLRISKGFRHQIRCHLAWMGMPIINDDLYGGLPFGNGLLGLRASSVSFIDPASGRELVYSILPLEFNS